MASIIVGAILVVGCSKNGQNDDAENISGVYVREHSFTVTNPETGAKIGMRTVRDTIFIEPSGEQYQVSNHKWMMNDYDEEGWRDMEHMDDRPLTPFVASFDDEKRIFSGKDGQEIFFDARAIRIGSDREYKKLLD